jgi:hypothetical protein
LEDVGSVGLEGDVEDAFRVPAAAVDVVGDVGDCGRVPVGGAVGSGNPRGAGGRGWCIRPSNLMPAGSRLARLQGGGVGNFRRVGA